MGEIDIKIVLTGIFGLIGLMIVLGWFSSNLNLPTSWLLPVGVFLAVILVVIFLVAKLIESD